MTDPFLSAACRRGLAALSPPSRVLLAVSGGPADSIALLDALWSGRARKDLRQVAFVVGHLDHGLRPESPGDMELVKSAAAERRLPFVYRIAGGIEGKGRGLEEAARTARYCALLEMAAEASCEAIVTAHTATDQAETLLWRLVRGAGRRGAGAMRPRRRLEGIALLRPLLGVTRDETRAYCARRAIRFHDDPSNEDHRPRARLRAEVLPVLERLSPGAIRRLAAAAARFREEDDWLEEADDPAGGRPLGRHPAGEAARSAAPSGAGPVGRAEPGESSTALVDPHRAARSGLLQGGSGEVELPSRGGRRSVAVLQQGRLKLRSPPGVLPGPWVKEPLCDRPTT